MKTNYLKKYIISSYILVWLLIIFVAGTASLVFHAPPIVMWIVRNLIAWLPTYLLLLGWKHFRPDETRKDFVKRCFSGKIKPLLLVLSFILPHPLIGLCDLFLLNLLSQGLLVYLPKKSSSLFPAVVVRKSGRDGV